MAAGGRVPTTPGDTVRSMPASKRRQGPKVPVADAPLPSTGPLAPGRPSNVKGIDLPLPHERDQGLDQVASAPDPVMRQAKRDLDAGQVDTDMRATPGLDAERRNGLVPTVVAPTASTPQPAPRVRTLKRR